MKTLNIQTKSDSLSHSLLLTLKTNICLTVPIISANKSTATNYVSFNRNGQWMLLSDKVFIIEKASAKQIVISVVWLCQSYTILSTRWNAINGIYAEMYKRKVI